jgi:uncharacterized lipoprotein YddW (UPF0748 family)
VQADDRKIMKRVLLLALAAMNGGVLASCAATYEASPIPPPPPPREFRAAWIATVANIDWPSKPGLSTPEQKRELLAILDRAAQLRLNAVIFQVRPMCDAFYASPIEPWSEYLTGAMGKAPEPFYDPLAFAVEEAHRRGLELHAWFNPYRALHFTSKSQVAASHVSKTHPQLVRKYGNYLWLDPGERDVPDYSLRVVMDVVKRYDIDGVHFDDYFYPDRADSGTTVDFPDEASWTKFGAGGKLSRDDWRRENVNAFIERAYHSVKAAKPWVKFGVSPRGIWRPGFPAQIKGMDAYANIFADSRKWLNNGWLDYVAPQLYWPIEPKAQSFPVLLNWWAEQNLKGRHLWPGLAAYKAGQYEPEEIPNQIRLTRKLSGVTGCVFYRMSSLARDRALAGALEREVFTQRALVPASPWLDNIPPDQPGLSVSGTGNGGARMTWQATGGKPVWLWVVQMRSGGKWTSEILPGGALSFPIPGAQPDVLAVTAIDRSGNASAPAVAQIKK